MKLFGFLTGVTLSLLSTADFAQTPAGLDGVQENAAMTELLSPGRKLVIESSSYRLEVVFSKDGTYKTSTGSSGAWTLQVERLCTVTKAGIRSCGRLPSNLKPKTGWSTNDYDNRPVTVSIQ